MVVVVVAGDGVGVAGEKVALEKGVVGGWRLEVTGEAVKGSVEVTRKCDGRVDNDRVEEEEVDDETVAEKEVGEYEVARDQTRREDNEEPWVIEAA